jgi:hypothetical protein
MNVKEYSRLEFGIGIFHVYAHEYPCQIQFNPRSIEGIGWSNGEGCERVWSSFRHFIPTLRSASAHIRLQTLSEGALEHNGIRFCAFSKDVCRSFASAFLLEQEARVALDKLAQNGLGEDEIERQHRGMKAYFSARASMVAVDINEDIYEALRAHKAAKELLDSLLHIGVKDSRTILESVSHLNSGNINSSWTPHTIMNRVEDLLKKGNQDFADWETPSGELTPLYREYERKYNLSEIRRVKAAIWEQLLQRNFESARLHGSLQGSELCVHALTFQGRKPPAQLLMPLRGAVPA